MEENLILKNLTEIMNIKETENGALSYKSTLNKVYDMFAFGGAYRNRSAADCILLFKNAYEENPTYAVKCLFYLRDIRGGQGERRFFRLCFNWLCKNYPAHARKLVRYLPEYGRYDDLWYTTINTELWRNTIAIIEDQLALDLDSKTPSLLAKWLPSENASSKESKYFAKKIASSLNISNKEYRKILTLLREKIKVVEKLMSENRWDEIEFDKIPSKAGLIYKNAFAKRDILAQKYKNFIETNNTKVNAKDLYPYEIVNKALYSTNELDREVIEKYWNNLPNYFNDGNNKSILCVVDTSGSMVQKGASSPINVAISLGMYCGERCSGPFKNHYISFASKPQLINIEGIDFVDKVERIYKTNLCDNTNLCGVFNLLKGIIINNFEAAKDLPDTIVVISDMEIDEMAHPSYWDKTNFQSWTMQNAATEMEKIRKEWAEIGLKLPKLVYLNVDARNNTILDSGDSVTFMSGFSPVSFEMICKGISGIDIMYEKLNSERYKNIQ